MNFFASSRSDWAVAIFAEVVLPESHVQQYFREPRRCGSGAQEVIESRLNPSTSAVVSSHG